MTDAVIKINDLRRRVLAKEPVTREELAEALRQLQAERDATSSARASKAAAAPKVVLPTDLNDLFK